MHTLFFIRHAESEANKLRILSGRLAYPLTQEGREDARSIAQELKEMTGIDGILTSPLLRAQQTAEAFADSYGIRLEDDERLCEQDLGPFTGKSYDEVKTMDAYQPDPLARWDWHPGGSGESYSMVADRVRSFLESVDAFRKGRWLIVTHAVVFRMLRAILENTLPIYPVGFPNNGEIWRVEYRGIGHHHAIESIFLGRSREFVHKP